MDEPSNSMLEAALTHAACGRKVFPCHPKTKRPLCKNGCKDATTDAAIIRSWWFRWPSAMIGCATGPDGAGLVVDIDAGIDPDSGEEFDAETIRRTLEGELGQELSP